MLYNLQWIVKMFQIDLTDVYFVTDLLLTSLNMETDNQFKKFTGINVVYPMKILYDKNGMTDAY